MQFLTKRHRRFIGWTIFVILIAAIAGLRIFVRSSGFEQLVSHYVIEEIRKDTGSTVSLEKIEWSFRRRHIQLDGLTLRKPGDSSDPPLARIARIDIGLNLRSLLKRRLDLFELTIEHPEFHLEVMPDGEVNLPATRPSVERQPVNVQLSIENFHVRNGTALINHRQVDIDFTATNLTSDLRYQGATGILSGQLKYDGQLVRKDGSPIPYTFDGDLDYTHGTLLPHRITLESGASILRLQGRIDALLDKKIQGRLEYTGNIQLPFLNYFFSKEKFAGEVAVGGVLEFSDGHFSTTGRETSQAVEYNGWLVKGLRSDYAYSHPERRATFENLHGQAADGSLEGKVSIENIPDSARILIDLNYENIDAAALARAYPWNAKYRVFSHLSGGIQGWIQDGFSQYSLSGAVQFKPTRPPVGFQSVALPLEGSTQYQIGPNAAIVTNALVQLGTTHIKASGTIGIKSSNLQVAVESPDLRDVAFVTSDANGAGTFDGALTGPIGASQFTGKFTLKDYMYRNKVKIDSGSGHLQFDTAGDAIRLSAVHIKRGRSEILLDGNAGLQAGTADLWAEAIHLAGEDVTPLVSRKIEGELTGRVHFTSLQPLRVEGDAHASNLKIDGHIVGDVRSHVRYFEPVIDLSSLTVTQGGSNLTGDFDYNHSTEAIKFSARITAVDIKELYILGVPVTLTGVLRQADVQGDGNVRRPNVRGQATLQSLGFGGQVFPLIHVDVTSTGSIISTTLDAGGELNLSAQINLASDDYPFTAKIGFTRYPLERLAEFSEGSLMATGSGRLPAA